MFRFLSYTQPTHYFRLPRKDGTFIYPKVADLPNKVLIQISADSAFHSEQAQEYDQSYRAILNGYIGDAECYTQQKKIPVIDEYYFIKKYFHPLQSIYVLMIRLFSFHDPIKELNGFWRNRSIKRVISLPNLSISHENWEHFKSEIVAKQPLVTVVIPTLNRYGYLKDVLQDFEEQTYKNFEIVVVDQSEPYQPEFYKKFNLDIRVIHQKEPALWLARNTAIQKAEGTIIALSEDDVRIPVQWIEDHLKCLDFFNAEISAGVFYQEGTSIPKDRAYFSISKQFATGNAVLYKSVFEKVGLFDRQFEGQRMGDGEFGLRCYLASINSVSNPFASCVDVKAAIGGLRQMGSWDAYRPKKWFSPRPIPSVLYFYRRYFGKKPALLALLQLVPPSIVPYRFKKNKPLLLIGIFISVFLLPILLIQITISWRSASKKLVQGPKIATLE